MNRRVHLLGLLSCVLLGGCSLIFTESPATGVVDGGVVVDADKRDGTDGVDSDAACEFVLEIASTADDGEVDYDKVLEHGEVPVDGRVNGIRIGNWENEPTWGFYRFRIPDGVVLEQITSAHLSLWGLEMDGEPLWNGVSGKGLTVWLSQEKDPGTVANISQGSLFGPERWPNVGGLLWSLDQRNDSPDLTDLFSQSVAEPGDHLLFWLKADFSDIDAEVVTNDFTNGENSAQLVLTMCE